MKSTYAIPLALLALLGPGCDAAGPDDEPQEQFALTEDAHVWDTPDFDAVCQQALGSGYRLADWHDIVAFVDARGIEAFLRNPA